MSTDDSTLRRDFDQLAIRALGRDHERLNKLEERFQAFEIANAGRRSPTMDQLSQKFVTQEQFKPYAYTGAAIAKMLVAAVVGGLISLVMVNGYGNHNTPQAQLPGTQSPAPQPPALPHR